MLLPRNCTWLAPLLFAALVSCAAPWGSACDTPVYRYAMYRWEATPYELYYFHRELPRGEDKAVQELVDRLGRREEAARANLVYLPVNLDDDKALVGVPADVKQAWLAQQEPAIPAYMLVTPLGRQLFFGKVDTAEVEKIVTSPVRQKFAARLEQGDTGVFVFVEGKDKQANEAALQLLGTLAADVEAGKVNLYAGAADMFPQIVGQTPGERPATDKPAADKPAADKPAADKPAADKPAAEREKQSPEGQPDGEAKPEHKPTIGLLRIARDDMNEQWLLRMLMASEPDLEKYADEPMVFVVYGRGRALPPYIGAGISRENMLDCLYFISGACSCTVKEQNPGIDLLVRYDWEKAAQKMAERFAGEEGADRFSVDNLFPELIFSPPKPKDTPKDPPQEPEAATPPQAGAATEPGAGEDSAAVASAQATPSTSPAAETRGESPRESRPAESAGGASAEDVKPGEQSTGGVENASPSTGSVSQDGVALVAPNRTSAAGEKVGAGETSSGATATAGSPWYALGIGVGVVLFVLLGATLLLYRPE